MDKIGAEAKRADEDRSSSYPLFSRALNNYGLKVGVEIGVVFGGHAEAILRQTQIDKLLYGVDPYRNFDGYEDPMNLPKSEFDALYELTKSRLAVRYKSNRSDVRVARDNVVARDGAKGIAVYRDSQGYGRWCHYVIRELEALR